MIGNTPLKYTQTIFKALRLKGYESQVTFNILKAEIKRQTGIVNDKKALQLIRTFKELGYLSINNEDGVFKILFWKDEKEIREEAKAIAEKEVELYKELEK